MTKSASVDLDAIRRELPARGAFEPGVLIMCLATSAFSAIICMQIIARIGVTPNTSIIGALIAMSIARIPFLIKWRSIHRQNLVQDAISSGGFVGANVILLAAGIPWVMGLHELIWPMIIGATIAVIVDVWFVYSLFDSPLFPGYASWPPGVATAETIIAGDEGGWKAKILASGVITGMLGVAPQFVPGLVALPMAGIGIAWIANIFAMVALGVGLLARGYSVTLFGVDIGKTYIPHGVMIGAGIVSLIQAFIILSGKLKRARAAAAVAPGVTVDPATYDYTVSMQRTRSIILSRFVIFTVGAVLLGLAGGIFYKMTGEQIVLWIVWAGISAAVSTVLVGLCAMHSGWFPAFALTLIFMIVGILMRFPAGALALLTGYTAATGPAFADGGYDFHSGWRLRGFGKDKALELKGRKQQLWAGYVGTFVALIIFLLVMELHWKLGLIPPVDKVYAASIAAGVKPGIAEELMLWAIPGAIVQLIGGPGRQLGILFATGLLIFNPIYGWGVLAAVAVRYLLEKKYTEKRVGEPMRILGSGWVGGDGLMSFIWALTKL